MAVSFLRMGRSCGLKSFQVNVCASWNRLFVASYSSKLGGSQYKDVRRTHVKKAKPKPKLDVAQLLLSLGMKPPAARPATSTATKLAVKDASRLTKPIAPAPSTVKTSSPLPASDPASAAPPPPLPLRPAPSSSVDFKAAAAATAAHLPVGVSSSSSPATVSGASAAEAASTSTSLPSPHDGAASPQPDHDASSPVVMEALSASAVVKQSELTESQSTTASQETTGTRVVVDVVVEVPTPAEHQPASPSLVVDVDAGRISQTTSPFSTMDSESLSDPSPVSAIDSSLSPSDSLPPTDSISQAVASTSAEETESVLREDVAVAAPPEDIVSVTQRETEAPETMATETIMEVTDTLTIVQVIPRVSSNAEVVSATEVTSEVTSSTSAEEFPLDADTVVLEDVVIPDLSLDLDVVSLLEMESFLATTVSQLKPATAEDGSAEAPSSTPAADAIAPSEVSGGLEIAPFLEDSDVPDLTAHLEAVSLLEVASFLETVPAADATDRSKSPSQPTISLEDVTVPDLTPSLEAVSLFEVEEFLQDISATLGETEGGSDVVAATAASPQTDLSSDSLSPTAAADDAMSLLEIAPSLKDAAVPDLTAQLEAVSLLEVGQFLESVPDTTVAAAATVSTVTSDAASSEAVAATVTTVTSDAASSEAVAATVTTVTSDAASSEAVAATVTTVTSDAASSEASTTSTSLPPKDIVLLDSEPQLQSVVTPAPEAMTPEGQGATESSPLQQPVVSSDIPTDMSSETVATDSIPTASKEPVVSMTTALDTPPLETTAQEMSTAITEPVASTTPSTDTVSMVTPSDSLLTDVLTTPPSDQLTATSDTVTLETPSDAIPSTEPLDMLHGDTPSTITQSVSDPLTSATPSDALTAEMPSTDPQGSVASVTPTDTATSEIPSGTDTLVTPVLTSVTAATLIHTIASEISDTASSAAQHEDTLSTASAEPLASTTTSDPVEASATILDEETPEVVATTDDAVAHHVPQVAADDLTDEPAAAAATQQQTPEDAAESLIPAAAVGLTDSPVEETQDGPTDVLAGVTTEEVSPPSIEAHLDPVQRLFLEKIREYADLKMAGEGRLEDGSEFQHRLAEEEAKLQRLYGGHDLTQFPEFNFPEPNLDEVHTK
ncbi:mucin-2-like [Engraulis encrasicolus]|uniref:mucin-2-like n=1 Tax=Engraulis encrasicolus TaxID=184585 RepID=UPI002FCFA7E6